jgi:hypothetical protein
MIYILDFLANILSSLGLITVLIVRMKIIKLDYTIYERIVLRVMVSDLIYGISL